MHAGEMSRESSTYYCGMDWQIYVGVIAALLGSTGIAGTLTGGFQLSRRARLRRSVERTAELLSKLDTDSLSRGSLRRAVDHDVLQLAALTLVSFPGDLRRLFRLSLVFSGIYIGLVAVIVSYSPPAESVPGASPDSRVALGWFVGMLGLILSIALSFNALLRNRRERFVDLIIKGADPEEALAEIGERSAIVRLLDWSTSIPFKLGEYSARAIFVLADRLIRGLSGLIAWVMRGLSALIIFVMRGISA
jgi:hypothetical protein